MRGLIDFTGQQFGFWTVISKAPNSNGRTAWNCKCGTERVVITKSLIGGASKSCGCYQKEIAAATGVANTTHGHSTRSGWSRTYRTWRNMINRCTNETHHNYERYGNNGIWMSERWLNSFQAFLNDMGECPEGHTLDRIDNNTGYCQLNCRWATPQEQQRNRRTNRLLTWNGTTRCIAEWAELTGLCKNTIRYRSDAGWASEAILTTPIDTTKKSRRKVHV